MPVPASEIKFSILMLAIPERIESMTAAVKHLQEQADAVGQGKAVEILVLLDNRSKSISEKRNDLLQIARGKYNTRNDTFVTMATRHFIPYFQFTFLSDVNFSKF
jgi:hypothetical protein